ncbi:MAG: efflux RND transporter periplasmic adaptor subunit [bacterium]|nr:efflux RND transporter periplasmic adaptor subunit [bacterium]
MPENKDRLKELRIDRADIETARSGGGAALAAIAVFLVLAGAGGWWWFSHSRAAAVRTATVEESSAAESMGATVLDASGYVTARRRATVSSKITGKIVEVMVEEGTPVDEGQILARLDDSTATRQLALAEAELTSAHSSLAETEVRLREAELNLRRTRALVDGAVASDAELDAAQAELEVLEARLARGREEVEVAERRVALRQQELDDMVIRAPFTGVAVTKDAQPGEMISPVSAGGGFTRTGIATVVDMSSLEIEVDVNEAYINRVSSGQKVVATLDAYPDWKIPAQVITTVPTADRQKATVRVRIAFEQLDPRILPDMGVKVSFLSEEEEIAAPAIRRLLIPAAAVREDGERKVVFVLSGETVERRAVRLGPAQGDQVTVIAGLSAGQQVVVEGPDDLADGDRVAVD